MDLNINILIGRLADNVRYEAGVGERSSRAVGRIIVNRRPSKDGKKRYDAVQIVAWGKNADNLAEYTAKGKELAIVGETRTNSVAPSVPGGEWKNYTEVLINYMSFGKDSAQFKAMKALQGGGPMAAAALAVLGTGMPEESAPPEAGVDWAAVLAADPTLKAQVQASAGVAAPAPVALPLPPPPEEGPPEPAAVVADDASMLATAAAAAAATAPQPPTKEPEEAEPATEASVQVSSPFPEIL